VGGCIDPRVNPRCAAGALPLRRLMISKHRTGGGCGGWCMVVCVCGGGGGGVTGGGIHSR